jgi:hypothetical protein
MTALAAWAIVEETSEDFSIASMAFSTLRKTDLRVSMGNAGFYRVDLAVSAVTA